MAVLPYFLPTFNTVFFFFQSSLSRLCQSLLGLSGFFRLSSHQTKVTHFRPCNVNISLPDTKFYLPIAALKTERERERERKLSKLNCLKQQFYYVYLIILNHKLAAFKWVILFFFHMTLMEVTQRYSTGRWAGLEGTKPILVI